VRRKKKRKEKRKGKTDSEGRGRRKARRGKGGVKSRQRTLRGGSQPCGKKSVCSG
jgi:hypothetical protein